jgi:hypothetical protein
VLGVIPALIKEGKYGRTQPDSDYNLQKVNAELFASVYQSIKNSFFPLRFTREFLFQRRGRQIRPFQVSAANLISTGH